VCVCLSRVVTAWVPRVTAAMAASAARTSASLP
jgi:hypothetical protein